MFIGINVFVFLAGIALTALSYGAYHRTSKRSLLFTVGVFLSITLKAIIDVLYEIGLRGLYDLPGDEILILQSIELILIGVGLALFYSLRQ